MANLKQTNGRAEGRTYLHSSIEISVDISPVQFFAQIPRIKTGMLLLVRFKLG